MTVLFRRDLGGLLRARGAPLVVAEVGVAEGRYSLEMLGWGLERLYLVDAWLCRPEVTGDSREPQEWHDRNLAACRGRVAAHGDRVTFLRGLSVDVAATLPDGSLGMAYLDACHERDAVAADLVAWWPKVVSGGVLAGHDYLCPHYGVREAVDEWAAGLGLEVNLIQETGEGDAGFWVGKP